MADDVVDEGTPPPDIRTRARMVRLDRLRLTRQYEITEEIARSAKLQTFHDRERERFAYRLHAEIFGEDVCQERVRWPADWREAFKQRWFPRWALKRWPVRWRSRTLKVKAVYPAFRPQLPEQEHRYIGVIMDGGIETS